MFKLVLEKAEEPDIKLPTSVGSWKKQQSSRKTFISALLTMPKPLTVWITRNCGKFWKRWEYQITWPASWETSMQVRKQQFHVIPTVKVFGIVNKAEIDGFPELYCLFDDPVDIGNLIFGSSAFSKTSLNIWKFTVHVLLKPGLENFEHYFTSMWDECNCVVVWAFFSIAFLWDWNENWPFPVLWPLLSFPNLLAYWVSYFKS